MMQTYALKRQAIWEALGCLKIISSSKDKNIQKTIDLISKTWDVKQELIKLNSNDGWNKVDLSWLPEKMKDIVLSKKQEINKQALELCVFCKFEEEIKSKDLHIERSEFFGDYKDDLINWKAYGKKVSRYCEIVGLPQGEKYFVNFIKSKLEQKSKKADNDFFDSSIGAQIKKGKLVLKKIIAEPKPKDFEVIDKLIDDRLESIGILDVITSVIDSLNLTKHLYLSSGHDSKLKNLDKHIAATIFCYGCNLGVNEGSRSLKNISRKQLGRINKIYITEEKLDACNVEIINCYNKYQLPKFWGTGDHVSVDGTKWDMYKKNLLSEYHIRYPGYGGIGYYHISDTYIALFSNLISCGSYEALHIIGEILKNESDIKPSCVHGDSHAQSFPIFALAYLLGIKIMPRIKGINKLSFYKASKDDKFMNLSHLFTKKINWNLIETHYKDMLRMAISIKECKTNIAAMMHKICKKSSKNKLYYAFRELGRVIKTSYLLEYITDFDLRKLIHSATCKSEEFNGFIDWVAFARNVIASNSLVEQRKFIKYNHLVANMAILYNVNAMSMVFRDLISEGFDINEGILNSFAPYRTSHISRLGFYDLESYSDNRERKNIINPSIDIFGKKRR